MRITRLIAGTVTAGLLGITPIALSAPAQAVTENLTTTTTVELPYADGTAMYGDKVTVRGAVVDSTGSSAYKGTVTLFQITAGNPAGTAIATVPASGYLAFPDVKVRENTAFKAVYSGYAATSTYENNYAGSESAPVGLPVSYKVTIGKAKKKLTIKGKVAPKYGKKKVKVLRKKGKRYVKYRTVKTDKKGKFQVTLPAAGRRSKLYFKITVPGNSKFTQYSEVWYTYSYRQQFRTAALSN